MLTDASIVTVDDSIVTVYASIVKVEALILTVKTSFVQAGARIGSEYYAAEIEYIGDGMRKLLVILVLVVDSMYLQWMLTMVKLLPR